MYKNKKDWYIWPGERRTPKYFFSFFFLRREGEKECLTHFFTSRQPPSALNKSTPGWPVEARKMAATKYFFARLGKSKQWLLLFLEELAQDYFSVMKKYQLEFQPISLLATVTIGLFAYRSYYIHLFLQVNRYYLSPLFWQLSNDFLAVIHDHT